MERNNQKALNSEWVTKSIEYHGQPLQKVWEGERGIQSLHNLGVRNPDFTLYQTRQKQFVFQDRAKRLKIHSFIAKKANELFATDPAKECARSYDLLHVDNGNRANATGEIMDKNHTIYIKTVQKKTKTNNAVTLILGLHAVMPPLNVFLPENAKINLVKRFYSVN